MFENKLAEIRTMINLDSTDIFSQLEEILADCGIVLTFLPYLDELAMHGATFCDGNKIVVALTKYDENNSEFWFNLFHELGHIILGHIYQVNGTNENDERDADNFAQEMLLITNDE